MPRISDERREARRQRILDAAMACFEKAGPGGASMQDIVAESGMSAVAIYGYFDSKEAIIEAVAADRHERERELLRAALATGGPDGLRQFMDACFAWIADPAEARRRRVTVHVWARAEHDERLRRVVTEGLAPLGDVERTLDGVALPDGVEPDMFARVLLALVQGLPAATVLGTRARPAAVPRHGHRPARAGLAPLRPSRVSLTPCSASRRPRDS
ncbi:TetR/AcrR family transcriptional regulator [Amycolatopsis australiensis]|uniref:DNA-binding transcriptional regulator, AcrR family n=1 Tax=Amycolatopsis australiensis TaxID=546364 RepID=A0A1K1RF48_9PSEU|nr:TetR/AcrR family transcriptional regulator [Amycolatopsis australiensis]SFW70310.1 DNA-binding transcriptional regulator, AcrR family [Amycolatopsis australiensis]